MRKTSAGWLLSALVVSSFSVHAQDVEKSGDTYHRAICDDVAQGLARCHAHVVTDRAGNAIVSTQAPVSGYGPADLRDAYRITTNGRPRTAVAAVAAFGYDNAEADLGVYRTQFGLPPCTQANGCFRKFNQKGKQKNYPEQNTGWALESALDLDMASAMCPNCRIWLVEADSNSLNDLAAAVDTAARLGAHAISNSYGSSESGTSAYESHYDHRGIAITASAGDGGFGTVQFPATSPHVIAVGGTHLVPATNARGWTETAIGGGGCSTVYPKPAWQTYPGCSKRVVADIAAVADPATGVAVYGPVSGAMSGWVVLGGTSVAAPIIAGVYGVNGHLVTYASDLYTNSTKLFDITSGTGAGPGYDPATGLGTPKSAKAFGP